MFREAGVGGEKERGAPGMIAEVHGAALREEEVKDLNGWGGGRQMLRRGQSDITRKGGRVLTIGVLPE